MQTIPRHVIYGEAQVGDWIQDFRTVKKGFVADELELTGFHYIGKVHPSDGKIIAYTVSDVWRIETVTQDNSVSLLGGVAGAGLGGLLLGPVGAVGGMLAGGKSYETIVKITLRDRAWFVARLNSGTAELLMSKAYDNQRAAATASQVRRFSQAVYDSDTPTGAAARGEQAANKSGCLEGCAGVVIGLGVLWLLVALGASSCR